MAAGETCRCEEILNCTVTRSVAMPHPLHTVVCFCCGGRRKSSKTFTLVVFRGSWIGSIDFQHLASRVRLGQQCLKCHGSGRMRRFYNTSRIGSGHPDPTPVRTRPARSDRPREEHRVLPVNFVESSVSLKGSCCFFFLILAVTTFCVKATLQLARGARFYAPESKILLAGLGRVSNSFCVTGAWV